MITKIPKGSILDPSENAAVVGGNVLTSQRIVDVIFKAFSTCAASQVNIRSHSGRAIAITWRQSSSSVAVLTGFLNSSPLWLLDQFERNLVWMFLCVSCIELMWGFLISQKTWLLLLIIVHREQTVVFHIYLNSWNDHWKVKDDFFNSFQSISWKLW